VKVGDRVSEGSVIAVLDAEGAAAGGEKAAPAAPPRGSEPAKPEPARSERARADGAPAAGNGAAPKAPQAGPQGATSLEVKVPSIGSYHDVPVIEVLVKAGDAVEKEQSLVTLESDKATMDVPAPAAGTVRSVALKVGDRVSEGTLVGVLEARGEGAPGAPSPPAPGAAAPAPAPSPPPAPRAAEPAPAPAGAPTSTRAHASPSVRKLARELGVDLTRVEGSGPRGRILLPDVQKFVKGVMTATASGTRAPGVGLDLLPWPEVDFAKFGPVERVPLSRIRKLSKDNLARNWVMIPHVTQHDEADVTELEAFRAELNRENEKGGAKVTILAFLVKACVAALRRFPEMNASLEGDQLVLKRYFNLGFAADTPNGLVVPVVKNADQKGILDIAKELGELAAKAREGKLGMGDMQGGTFTISSLGGIGGSAFTPIINAPEVGILGVSRAVTRPLWDGQAFRPRLVLPLSLSYDHRVIDGAQAARFTTFLAKVLGDFRRAML
jgi:pyruvate dehydrogenase E2 component (dihydrolipoamide acetyltransferase)